MYAIVDIAGKQYRVQKDQHLRVHRLDAKEGEKVQLDRVLLISDGGKTSIGSPVLDGACVNAKVLSHVKGTKVLVFHKKRRKGYSKMNGHRQYLTELVIEGIKASGATKSATKKETAKPVVAKAAAPTAEKPVKAAPAPKKASSTKDDLKKVEGIGPKIEETLNAAGINTYADLAKAKAAKITEIIAEVRGNHVPDTWPEQAKLAADGKWDELNKLQDELNGGKK